MTRAYVCRYVCVYWREEREGRKGEGKEEREERE